MGLGLTGAMERHCASGYRHPGSDFECRVGGGYSARGAPLWKSRVPAVASSLSERMLVHSLSLSLSLCLFTSLTHTHTQKKNVYTHTHTHTHVQAHTHYGVSG